jgi:outer membrane protein assembly factor BamB
VDEGGHMRIYALNAADGTVKWTYESEDGFTKQVYATDDVVSYIAYQDFVVGVNAHTGELLWRRDTGNWVPTLMGDGDVVYYGAANTMVHAIQANSGDSIWDYNIPEGTFNYLIGAPVLVGDELIFLTQLGEIFSLDAATGDLRWHNITGIVGARTGLSVSGGWLFIGNGDGTVYGFSD